MALDLTKLYAARLYAAQARPYLATALFALPDAALHRPIQREDDARVCGRIDHP